jgi:hypothetical protein
MATLIVSRLTRSVTEVGYGGAAHFDGVAKNVLERAAKLGCFLLTERGTEARRMDSGAPETFIGVDIADAAKDGLVEEESFDTRAPGTDACGECFGVDFERLGSKAQELVAQELAGQIGHPPETARVGVAEFSAIVEFEEDVGVLAVRRGGGLRSKVAGHTKVNEKSGLLFTVFRHRMAIGEARRKTQQHELAEPFDGFDAATRKMLLEGNGIVDEIGFAEADGKNAAAGDRGGKSASDGFDFRKFGHGRKPKDFSVLSLQAQASC